MKLVTCSVCGEVLSTNEKDNKCPVCGKYYCNSCVDACKECGELLCCNHSMFTNEVCKQCEENNHLDTIIERLGR